MVVQPTVVSGTEILSEGVPITLSPLTAAGVDELRPHALSSSPARAIETITRREEDTSANLTSQPPRHGSTLRR